MPLWSATSDPAGAFQQEVLTTFTPAEAGGRGEGREKLILVWKTGQGQIWVTSASASRSVDNSDSPLPRHYCGWAVPDSGFQGGRQPGSLAVLMPIWAALMLRPLDLPISCLCAYKHIQSLSKRGDVWVFFTMSKRSLLAPCVCTEISGDGSTAHCSKPARYFRAGLPF